MRDTSSTAKPFEDFLSSRRSDFNRIASRTRGELSSEDLASEAWLMAIEIGHKRGWPLRFDDQDDQDTLFSWLHNRFVRYAEKAVRFAMRLDRNWDNEDGEQTGAALARLLTAPLDTDPQIRQQALDDQDELISVASKSYSEATAYILLLVRVDWHLEDLAEMLQIGSSALMVRLRASGLLARVQPSLFDGIEQIDADFQPWKRRRSLRLRTEIGQYSQAPLWT